MAEKNPIYHDIQNSESTESLSPDEWTMIEENWCEKDDGEKDATNNDDAIENDSQEISRSIEELRVPVEDAIDDNNENVIIERQAEDSDGISVITESDAEQSVERKAIEEMETCQDHRRLCTTLNKYEKLGEKSAPQVGTILNVVIACSLAAIIGLGAGRILGMDEKCPVKDSLDFPTIKIESDLLIDQIRELGEVKNVLDEIKASIPQMKETPEKRIPFEGSKSRSKRAERRKKLSKISETHRFDSDNTILEQLQTSLNTLSSVIDEIKPENEVVSSETLRTQEIVTDLIKFKEIIDIVIKELEDAGEPKEIEFFRNAEKKIKEICKSLLEDLTRTIHGLTSKMHKKLNKVRHKLNKRLCLLKISESIDREMFKPLEENNSFLESCDKVLNAASKPETMKMNKKKMYNKKNHPKKTSLNDSSVIKSAESDDGYSKYSSSDSSMPDLTYNRDIDNDFWKEKRNSWRKEKNVKHKSRKNTFGVDKKMVNPKKFKGSSQNWRNVIMDVMEAEETCPAAEEVRFELETPKEKPLYSSVVKSTAEDTESKRSNLKKQKADRKKFEVEGNFEGKQMLTETKHNVTPAESDVNVLQVKKIKKQSNVNVREQVVRNDDDRRLEKNQWGEEDVSERCEDPKQAKNSEKISASRAAAKCYLKNKKVHNNFDASSEMDERQEESTTNHVDQRDRVAGDKWKKIPTHHDDKKSKKEKKSGRKNVSSQKIIATKTERDTENRNDKQKTNDRSRENWQLQRSRAREIHRDRDHRSGWFFDRADYRQDARKIVNARQYCWKGKCQPILEEGIRDEKDSEDWFEFEGLKARKHSGGRAGFTTGKPIKMPHRKNIFQSKHY